jgi:hypothetical protein
MVLDVLDRHVGGSFKPQRASFAIWQQVDADIHIRAGSVAFDANQVLALQRRRSLKQSLNRVPKIAAWRPNSSGPPPADDVWLGNMVALLIGAWLYQLRLKHYVVPEADNFLNKAAALGNAISGKHARRLDWKLRF